LHPLLRERRESPLADKGFYGELSREMAGRRVWTGEEEVELCFRGMGIGIVLRGVWRGRGGKVMVRFIRVD
jgi:hypothetical protein